eukprot:12262020-Heterocapsa_arctica.AAC.1
MDWLREKHFQGLRAPEPADGAAPVGPAGAAMKANAAAIAKALRQSAGNALVATTVWMGERGNYDREKILQKIC